MLKPQPANPNAPDQVAPKLFKPDSFAMRLKALADELFSDDRWRDMYSQIGRTARSPKGNTRKRLIAR